MWWKERNDYYPFGARHVKADYPRQAVNRFKYNGKEEQVTGDLGYLDYGARMYDGAIGRWFGVDPLQESFLSLSPYNYCSSNPVIFIDPNGALRTHYVDENYNTILQTNDGSDDVVMVPNEHVGTFRSFATFYQDPSVRSYYDDERWNRYWKNQFGLAERQLTEVELAISNWYKSENGKNEAIKLFLSHKGSHMLKAAWSEASYHLFSVESWADGLSMTFGVKGLFKNFFKKQTSVYKHEYKYAARVRARAIQDPVSHNFPYSFDDAILSTKPIVKRDGYKIYQMEGTMNGIKGIYEIGITKDGIIDHRFFRALK